MLGTIQGCVRVVETFHLTLEVHQLCLVRAERGEDVLQFLQTDVDPPLSLVLLQSFVDSPDDLGLELLPVDGLDRKLFECLGKKLFLPILGACAA